MLKELRLDEQDNSKVIATIEEVQVNEVTFELEDIKQKLNLANEELVKFEDQFDKLAKEREVVITQAKLLEDFIGSLEGPVQEDTPVEE